MHGSKLLGDCGVCPIPGTSNPKHLEDNLKACGIAKSLTPEDMAAIEAAVPKEEFSNPTWRYGDNRQKVWATDQNIGLEEWKAQQKSSACIVC